MPNSSIGVAVQVRSGMCMHTITTGAGCDPLVVLNSILRRSKRTTDRQGEANSPPFTSEDQPAAAQANPQAAVFAGGGGRSTVRSVKLPPNLGRCRVRTSARAMCKAHVLPQTLACILHPPRPRPSTVGLGRRYIMRDWRACAHASTAGSEKKDALRPARTQQSPRRRAGSLGSLSGTGEHYCPTCIGIAT